MVPEALANSLAEAAKDVRLVEALKPEQSARALLLLSEGATLSAAARRTGIDRKTMKGLAERHEEVLKLGREATARRASRLALKAGNIMLQKLALIDLDEADGEEDRVTRTAALQKLNVRDLAVSFAVLVDKLNVLEGSPAATAPEIATPSVADAGNALEQLRASRKVEQDAERERRESEIAEAVQRRLAELEGARGKVVGMRVIRTREGNASRSTSTTGQRSINQNTVRL